MARRQLTTFSMNSYVSVGVSGYSATDCLHYAAGAIVVPIGDHFLNE